MILLSEFLLDMTIGSCVTAGAIILTRLLFGRFLSARSKYLLWMLLAVRLCMPVLLYSPWSLYHISAHYELEQRKQDYIEGYYDESPQEPFSIPDIEHMTLDSFQFASPEKREEFIRRKVEFEVNKMLPKVYVMGVLISFGAYVLLRNRTRKVLAQSVCVEDVECLKEYVSVRSELGIQGHIRLCYGAEPMITGILNPVLLIPRELQGEELRTTLVHELLHYKNADLCIAAFQRILCCIYWFNPVIWLCFRHARKDCELACDQQVLQYGYASEKEYAELLFREGEMKRKLYIGSTAFGASGLKKRIKAITKYKKPTRWMAAVSIVLVVIVSGLTMTGSDLRNVNIMISPRVQLDTEPEIVLTEPGQLYCIEYTAKPANASVVFLSDNYDVAYANGLGVVTAVGPGNCELTVKTGYWQGDEFKRGKEVGVVRIICDFDMAKP